MSDTERTVRVAAALLGINVEYGRHTGMIYLHGGGIAECYIRWEEALKFLTKLKGQEKPK